MKRVIFGKVLAGLAVFVMAASASAGEKIGIFSMSRVVNESLKGKEMQAQLIKLREKQQKTLQGMAEKIKAVREEMRTLDPSDPKLDNLRETYRTELEEYRRVRQRLKKELDKRFRELSARIAQDVRRLVREIAKKKRMEYVFEERGSGVVFFPASRDITDEIIKLYDREYKKRKR